MALFEGDRYCSQVLRALQENPMAKDPSTENPPEQQAGRPRVPLPVGYRPGIITAITVMLGFSLVFVRYWDFELPGAWSISSTLAAILMAVAIVLQTIALWRSLQVKDDDESEYSKTLRWFLLSTVVLLISLAMAGLSFSHVVRF
jgi:hypothetical protein